MKNKYYFLNILHEFQNIQLETKYNNLIWTYEYIYLSDYDQMKRLDKLWFVFFQPGVLSQAQFGHKITQVTGSDRDTGVNAALTYSINSVLNINEYGDKKVVPAHTFTISKSDGSVSLNDSLLLYHRDYFEVDVGIEDGSGSKTSSKLRVSIFPFVCLKSPTIEVFKRWCPSPLYKNVKNVRSLPELGQSLGIKS